MKTYTGHCHCQAVTFKVEMDLSTALICNCSHCHMKGMALSFVPKSQFKLLTGADNLTEYRFHKKVIGHQFCKICGVEAFAYGTSKEGEETAMVNLRCLDDIDLESLPTHKYNGKDI